MPSHPMLPPKLDSFGAKNPAWLALWMKKFTPCKLRTWILVPRPANTNIVGSKWVFRTKYLPDGSIERLKARLVAKGYFLVSTTLTPSACYQGYHCRVVLSLAVTNKWPWDNLMSRTPSANGSLTEHQALVPGFSASGFPPYIGFSCSRAHMLFVFQSADLLLNDSRDRSTRAQLLDSKPVHTPMFLLPLTVKRILRYVKGTSLHFGLTAPFDHLLAPGSSSSLLITVCFTHKLHSEFATKDLGSLSYFLGLEALPTPDGLFLSQLKYARDILTRAQLLDSKPVHTPMVVSQHLSADGPLFPDPTLYRSLVGALQYLTITRPDIAHAVNSVSQFMHAPTADHFLAVKRILRYVKGTLHFGLTFRPSAAPGTLVAYSDADWAGCPDTRRSTSGYSIYLVTISFLGVPS
uniref:Reverse transcriptase Ty1/copia-type domain-containing protein n=1 Tax=Fagus sylvatica TaxID=28930 RepID=A0A2N9ICA8_FAGSY